MPVIEDIVSKVEDWKGKPVSIQRLSGGLTNTNYKVEVEGQPFFIRVPGVSTELLAIDRNNEYFNSKAAAEAGVGPKVLYYLTDYQAMVLEFINWKNPVEGKIERAGHANAHGTDHPEVTCRSPLPHRLQHVPPHGILSQDLPGPINPHAGRLPRENGDCSRNRKGHVSPFFADSSVSQRFAGGKLYG